MAEQITQLLHNSSLEVQYQGKVGPSYVALMLSLFATGELLLEQLAKTSYLREPIATALVGTYGPCMVQAINEPSRL
jgi:hypothetical protein